MQWPVILSARDILLRLTRLFPREIGSDADEGVELTIQRHDALWKTLPKHQRRKVSRSDLAG